MSQDLAEDVLLKVQPSLIDRINVFSDKQYKAEISNNELLQGLDEKIDEISKLIDCEITGGEVRLDENNNFVINDIYDGCMVDKNLLIEQIIEGLKQTSNIELNVPTIAKKSNLTKEDIQKNIQLRSSYSTNYASSIDGRKNNVQLALSAFNGLKVDCGQEISFNQIVNEKIDEEQFKTAKVIVNGEFVDGKGGGICQASTTLYNALILSDIDILEVHSHSLPVHYVPLAFDAMVNQGSADLKFKNNLQKPVYIKAWGDKNNAYVEIWGEPFEDGKKIQTKSEFIGTLPHHGDKIIPDTEGKYSQKITFKGEYVREKLPQEGYESKAIIQYVENGEIKEEKVVRHEYYQPQYGIIYEGVEDIIEGITLPENTVKFIPPQQSSHSNQNIVTNKIQNAR